MCELNPNAQIRCILFVSKIGCNKYLLDACHAGVLEAVHHGMSRVILQTDSQLVKLVLETNTYALAPTGGVVF
jgi:hypothetical protein